MFDQQRVINALRSGLILLLGMVLLARASEASDVLPDPTRPAQYRGKDQAESYRLESILNSSERRVAIINGKVLAVGDSIGDARLNSIGRDSVILQVANKTVQLKLRSSAVRKEVSTR